MAKKQEDTIVDVAGAYSKTESFFNQYGKTLAIALIAAFALGIIYFLVKTYYLDARADSASAEIWKAQYYLSIDSTQKALNGDDEYLGFYDIVDEYSGTPSEDIAYYSIGVILLQDGEFEEAIAHLEEASFSDVMLECVRNGAIGDAYIELGDFDNGLSYYDNAINHAANDFTTPIYLKKKGLCLEELEEYEDALEAYQRIEKEYSSSTQGRDIGKYIARAEARLASS